VADILERRSENVRKRFVEIDEGEFAERVVAVNADGTAIGGGGGGGEVSGEVALDAATIDALRGIDDATLSDVVAAVEAGGSGGGGTTVHRQVQSAALTIAVTAYTSGDQVGDPFEITNAVTGAGEFGTITDVTLLDEGDVMAACDLLLFNGDPSAVDAGDNAAFTIADADIRPLIIGMLPMPGFVDIGANRISALNGIAQKFHCTGTSLWAIVVTRSANAIFTAVTDLNLQMYITQH
jgi:hypothetical protein